MFYLQARTFYNNLQEVGIEVLYDDRDVSPGVKLADSDLIGCPSRIVISSKTLKNNNIEFNIIEHRLN